MQQGRDLELAKSREREDRQAKEFEERGRSLRELEVLLDRERRSCARGVAAVALRLRRLRRPLAAFRQLSRTHSNTGIK